MNWGERGLSPSDPSVLLLDEVGGICADLGVRPVLIGGLAVIAHGYPETMADMTLLVTRTDALKLSRRLSATAGFSKVRIDRFRHASTQHAVELCVEGEPPMPMGDDRFPSPGQVEQIDRRPLPIVGLIDLLALKLEMGRAQDQADFIGLVIANQLTRGEVERVRTKIQDPALKAMLDRWHARALEEIERDKLRKPPELE